MSCPSKQVLYFLLLYVLSSVYCQDMPVWVDNMIGHPIDEDTTPGSSVYKLHAYIPSGAPVLYEIKSEYFLLAGADVILKRLIDVEEQAASTTPQLIARNAVKPTIFNEIYPVVKFVDVNDNEPKWNETSLTVRLEEDTPVGTTVVDTDILRVTDADVSVNELLTVKCDPTRVSQQNAGVCDVFSVTRVSQARQLWDGRIILEKTLDYETKSFYQIPLVAFDGKFQTLLSVEVDLLNVQDTPPKWENLQSIRKPEEVQNYTVLFRFQAQDGDGKNLRKINYAIIYDTPESRLFTIDPVTGDLYNLIKLDREAYPFRSVDTGSVTLRLAAREIDDTTGAIGNSAENSTQNDITVQIDDINDNKPLFSKTSYNVSLQEGEQNETPLVGASLLVSDDDRDDINNNFQLVLSNYNDGFDLSSTIGKSTASALIRVKNSSLIDYEKGPTQYKFQVIARETTTSEKFSSVADVTVNIIDVNDNYPEFAIPTHKTSVLETYQQPDSIIKIVATDKDTGLMGTAGIVYELTGAGSNLFSINKVSGEVFVASCPTPGSGNCLDYEQKKQYLLTVTATDEKGSGNLIRGTLQIDVLDVNDNAPRFVLKDYQSSVDEGQTEPNPSIIVSATDVDTVGGPISYTLIPDATNVWKINPSTGKITAKKPVLYTDTVNDQGTFNLVVQASDGKHTATANVIILVIDINNFSPVFVGTYEVSINETTPGGKSIISVEATDGDAATHANGQIDYKIVDGAEEKFFMSGKVISTGPDAKFDYNDRQRYIMTIQARDRGTPSRSGTVSVTVNILDINNKNPYINPDTQRTDVYENALVGTKVHETTAEDSDANHRLEFFFIEPKTARSPTKDNVDRADYDFTNLFKIDQTTGHVTVNSKLDRKQASFLIYTVKVVDVNASPQQTGTGLLFITILEYNVSPPYFIRHDNVTVEEEKRKGSFVTAVQARDTDDAIAEYQLISNPFDHFTINFRTGSVTINKPLDFEVIESTYFDVRAFDDGVPRLSNSTRIYVNVLNINDNYPKCLQQIYRSTIKEHSPAGTDVAKLAASDKDKGDFGVWRFRLDDTRFIIDPILGNITVAPGRSDDLDREKEEQLVIQVTVSDSPNNPTQSKFTLCSVYVDLEDINDNGPKFKLASYKTTILETTPVQTSILQLSADDRDIGLFGVVAYSKVPNSGDSENLFSVSLRSGTISIAKDLMKKTGTYRFDVKAVDEDGNGPYSDVASVEIVVLDSYNSLPVWLIPPSDNMTISVLEEQYDGMIVIQVKAFDEDSGNNGKVDYHIFENGVHKECTKEFCINSVTGVIFANRVYDREERERYTLLLTARDNGNIRLETTRYLTVVILDVNDNKPEFQRAADGSILPLDLEVKESTAVGTVVGLVQATDRDKDPVVYYVIINGNEDEYFRVNSLTGDIILNKKLNREVKSAVYLSIQATNNISDYTVIRNRRRRAVDPSIINVNILVGDTNDESPVFTQKIYHGCVAKTASIGQSIIKVEAKDADSADVKYSILSGNVNTAFKIDESQGIISNRILMKESTRPIYEMKIEAKDESLKDTADAVIFVTEVTDSVVAVLTQPASEVRKFIAEIQSALMKFTDSQGRHYFKFVCYSSVTDHVLDNGETTSLWSDVTFYAICEDCVSGQKYHVYTGSELLRQLKALQSANKDGFDLLYIKTLKLSTDKESLTDRTPVLVVLIIIILLFVLILAFLIITCYCIRKSNRRHKAILASQRREDDLEEETKNVNPMYDNYGYDPEPNMDLYAKVHKPHVQERPQQPEPVVVPPVMVPEPDPESEEDVPVIIDHVETEYIPEFTSNTPSPRSEQRSIPDDTVIETELIDDDDDRVSNKSDESEFRIETTLENTFAN